MGFEGGVKSKIRVAGIPSFQQRLSNRYWLENLLRWRGMSELWTLLDAKLFILDQNEKQAERYETRKAGDFLSKGRVQIMMHTKSSKMSNSLVNLPQTIEELLIYRSLYSTDNLHIF